MGEGESSTGNRYGAGGHLAWVDVEQRCESILRTGGVVETVFTYSEGDDGFVFEFHSSNHGFDVRFFL